MKRYNQSVSEAVTRRFSLCCDSTVFDQGSTEGDCSGRVWVPATADAVDRVIEWNAYNRVEEGRGK